MVRPVYRISSTSTMRLPSTSKSILLAWDLRRERGEVIAVEADIQAAERQTHPLDLLDLLDELLGKQVAACHDAHEREVLATFVPLEDLVRDARNGAVDGGLVHDDRLRLRAHRTPSSYRCLRAHHARPRQQKRCPTAARHGHPEEGTGRLQRFWYSATNRIVCLSLRVSRTTFKGHCLV